MVGCSIRKCKSRSVKGGTVRFFTFPVKESVADEWLRFCGPKTTIKNGRVCSNHFLPSDYIKPLKYVLLQESPRKIRNLRPDAIPTLQLDDMSMVNKLKTFSSDVAGPLGMKINAENIAESHTTQISQVTGSSQTIQESSNKVIIEIPANGIIKSESNEILMKSTEESDDNITISVAEYKYLKKKAYDYNHLKHNLEQIFTTGQIRCLLKSKNRRSRIRWSAEDITAAITLRSISLRGYHYLRDTVGIPLPGFSTLCKWASKINKDQGRHGHDMGCR